MALSVVIATSLNKKTRPNTGREFNSRGSTRFTLSGVALGATQSKGISEACNGATRSTYWYGWAAAHPHVQPYAHEWFSVIFPGRDSQSPISSPCQGLDHLLVSVIAFSLICVGEIGLEPTTSAMSKQCSNQLSYPPEGLTL